MAERHLLHGTKKTYTPIGGDEETFKDKASQSHSTAWVYGPDIIRKLPARKEENCNKNCRPDSRCVSAYDPHQQNGHLIPCLSPNLNQFRFKLH